MDIDSSIVSHINGEKEIILGFQFNRLICITAKKIYNKLVHEVRRRNFVAT